MILGKFWGAISAQLNKIANIFWEADPIAQMQLEHDRALESGDDPGAVLRRDVEVLERGRAGHRQRGCGSDR